ncbi:hypothetical protein GCM10023203_27220 [Actinomycetospora straminea]|uniref:DUF4365 domain-containing protein n=2 Tax=Actinomycetospora straminea TaxID=663607 RepID=A0ABP9ECS9_9PSEU
MPPTTRVKPVFDENFTDCMEQLQEGYVGAVAATAGCSFEIKRKDRYGSDIEIVRPGKNGGEEVAVKAQLKSTTQLKPSQRGRRSRTSLRSARTSRSWLSPAQPRKQS